MNPIPPNGAPPQGAPVSVQSETLRALTAEGHREWSVTEPWFYLLLGLIVIDIVLGFLWAFRRQDIASNALFDGLKKKVTMVLVIAALVMLDPFVPGLTLSVIAAAAYVTMECLSITEKAAKLGAPVPEPVTRVLRAMRPPEAQPVRIVGEATVTVSTPPSEPVPVQATGGKEAIK